MDPRNRLGFSALPPVSFVFAVGQALLYLFQTYIINYDEDIWVSWDKVIVDGEFWRLFVAQYFHFTRGHLFWSVVTLLTVGRYLEKKLTKTAMILLIQLLGTLSNVTFLLLNLLICSGDPSMKEMSYGFSHVIYALRMCNSLTKDPPRPMVVNGVPSPSFILGFYAVDLPSWISPWQPLLEVIFIDLILGGLCAPLYISGIIAGLTFPILNYTFHRWIYRDPPQQPPPPPTPT